MLPNVVEEKAYREKVQVFRDRVHAGELLSQKLKDYDSKKDVLVLVVPSGGVPVGSILANKLHIDFDVIVVRKVQIPWNTEAGFGSVTWDGEVILNEPLVQHLGLSKTSTEKAVTQTKKIVKERLKKFRGQRPLPDLHDKTVILVDDGLASGFTMLAAIKSIKKKKPKEIVIAVPTASLGAVELLTPEVDKLVCLNIRSSYVFAVADAYMEWYDLSDEEVMRYLES